MYAQVVFPLPFRNSFTYSIPKEFENTIQVGLRVVAPFGKRVLTGFVVGFTETTDLEKIKPIKDILDEKPIFDEDSLRFYNWISDYYISSLGEALKNSVPYGTEVESKRKVAADIELCYELHEKEKNKKSTRAKLLKLFSEKEVYSVSQLQKLVSKKNIYSVLRTMENEGAITVLNQIEDAKVGVKKLKFVELAKSIDETYEHIPAIEAKSPKQVVILLELISGKGEAVQLTELLKKTDTSRAAITSLEKKELVKVYDKEVERNYLETYNEKLKIHKLTEPQQAVVDEVGKALVENRFETFLLHGITGSGKTQVYIDLTKECLEHGKTALILVPEISLTPQITSRFFNNFGDQVTVLHSRMSLGERYDSWRGIIASKSTVVIGPRSALFAPLKNIGLLVVDEEHDQSYKQYDLTPKYHARDAAIIRGMYSNAPVVLGSATPSIESMYNARAGKYKLLELKERVDNAQLPKIRLIDITVEKKQKKMESAFSKILLTEIEDRIKKKEGVIILQNRRGFSTQVYCDDCGEIVMCPNCSVAMVHHLNRNLMQCHYCNVVQPVPKACSNCGSLSLKFFGTGTQRVEDELAYYFPNIRIERIDSDSVNKKGKLGIILNRFRNGEIDVLVGTQMVSKGLDFSNVTLVGVISAETTLWLPDFRADERTFQLLTQVAGRAGRSKTEGEVIIQTQNHKNFVLQKVLANDYEGFYTKELYLREKGGYPPFTRLALIESKDENEIHSRGAINGFYDQLKNYQKHLIITPPSEAVIARIKGQYRFQILIKSSRKTDPSGKLLRTAVINSLVEYNKTTRYRDVKLIIDIDPQSII